MSEFQQRNQQFGTLDLVMLVVLCGLVSTVIGASLTRFLQDPRPGRALSGAQALAEQLRERHEAAFRAARPDNRAPASVEDQATAQLLSEGELGRDPWGHPYHYFVRPPTAEGHRQILVWSDGANGRTDTDARLLASTGGFSFGADDIGYSVEAKP